MRFSNSNKILNEIIPNKDDVVSDIEKELNSEIVNVDENENITEFVIPKEVLDYLENLIKLNKEFSGPLRVLKYDIEDDESLPIVLSKLEKAKNSGIFKESDFNRLLKFLGINEYKIDESFEGVKKDKRSSSFVEQKPELIIESKIEIKSDIKIGDYVNYKNETMRNGRPHKVLEIFEEDGKEFVKLEGDNGKILRLPISILEKVSGPEEKNDELDVVGGPELKPEVTESEIVDDSLVSDEVQTTAPEEVEIPKKPDLLDRIRMAGEAKKENEENSGGLVKLEKQGIAVNKDTNLEKDNVLEPEIIIPNQLSGAEVKNKPEDIIDADFQVLNDNKIKTEEEIAENLNKAREVYASLLVEHKNKIREKKNFFHKILSDLGIEKQMPELERSQEFLDAEKAYMEAKKKRAINLFDQNETRRDLAEGALGLRGGEEYKFNEKLLKLTEEEYQNLQNKILENVPPLEKSRIGKAFEKWTKLPMPARIALTTTLMVGVGVTFGIVPVGGVGATLVYRGARSMMGATLGQAAGGIYGAKKEKQFKERTEKARLEYAKNIDLNNFEEKEKEFAKFFEKEENQKRKDFWKKAGVMMAVGAGVNVGAEIFAKPSISDISGGGKNSSALESKGGPKVGNEIISSKNLVETKLSSKGFIQTFDDMKDKLKAKYPDPSKMPKGIKDFVETKDVELAKKYGFYDPNKNLSGMGMKGESLSLDDKGNLRLTHLNGKSEIINTTNHKFGGKMFGIEEIKSPKIETIPSEMETRLNATNIEPEIPLREIDEFPQETLGPEKNIDSLPKMSENLDSTPVPKSLNSFDTVVGNQKFHIDIIGGKEAGIILNNVKIAEEIPNPNGSGGGVMRLLDKYQDGKKYASIREAFVKAQTESMLNNSLKIVEGQSVSTIPFESGKIDIFKGVGDNKNAIGVFLNGKEIAKGVITEKGPQVKIFNNLKGGFFLADTVYERAFKIATKTIKTIKIMK